MGHDLMVVGTDEIGNGNGDSDGRFLPLTRTLVTLHPIPPDHHSREGLQFWTLKWWSVESRPDRAKRLTMNRRPGTQAEAHTSRGPPCTAHFGPMSGADPCNISVYQYISTYHNVSVYLCIIACFILSTDYSHLHLPVLTITLPMMIDKCLHYLLAQGSRDVIE